jgi:hypothetical protein
MFTKIDDITIQMDFNNGIKVHVKGPDLFYYVEIYEYEKNSNVPKYLEGHQIHSIPMDEAPFWKQFKFDARFYMDFEIRISRVDRNEGIQLVHTHRYNDRGRYVKFEIINKNKEETELWVDRINKYCEIHKCIPVIKTDFTDINHRNKNFFLTDGIEYYRTYKIGRFPKASKDFKTMDPRKKGFLWFGFWKIFWSYEHPRNWKILNSQEVVDDILGL